MMRALLLLSVALSLCACRASESQCTRLLDHFVDVEGDVDVAGHFQRPTAKLADAVAREKHAYREELHDAFVARCLAELSSAEVRCALQASDEAGLDHCEGR
jgi:hypothetical protein